MSLETSDGEESSSFASKVQPLTPFHLKETFWAMIESDAQLKADLEALIEERVRQKIALETDAIQQQLKEAARQEGLQNGAKQALEEANKAVERLDAAARSILQKEQGCMKAHESHWAHAFAHLLKRFLVPKSEEILAQIQSWMAEGLGDHPNRSKVLIFVSSGEFDRLSPLVAAKENAEQRHSFELLKDASLNEGEIRCECDGAGIWFSPSEQMEKLEKWIEKEFPLKGGAQ